MSHLRIATIVFLVSLSGSTLAEDDYWFCNTNPGQGDKTVYVSNLLGPFAPAPGRLTAQQDVRADFMKFIQENHPDALANHKGGEHNPIYYSDVFDLAKGPPSEQTFKDFVQKKYGVKSGSASCSYAPTEALTRQGLQQDKDAVLGPQIGPGKPIDTGWKP